MTSSSSAAAGTGWRRPTTSRRTTGSPTSRCWSGAISAAGNVGRNTTIVRANYLLKGNGEFYSHSLRLWEGLEQELNYNVMMSQRGVLNLCHSDGQFDAFARRGNAMRLQGDDAELLTRDEVRAGWPFLNFDGARFPIRGGLLQRRAGTARHDAVAWGFARGADCAGGRPDPELRGDGVPDRGGTGARGGDLARFHRVRTRSGWRWPGGRARWGRWRGCGCRSRATFCRRS